MKYRTTDELAHFSFHEACIAEMKQMNGYFYAILDNVKILPENSCNRDIREMRTNDLTFKIPEGRTVRVVEEGYKVYDANGNLKNSQEDVTLKEEEYNKVFDSLRECYLYSIEQKQDRYFLSIDTEDHTFLVEIEGSKDVEEWDRFFQL